jgi:UrcA family protein
MLAIGSLIGSMASPALGRDGFDDGLSQASPSAVGAQTKSQVISYSDLDLSTPQGASALVGRINNAAERVCEPEPVHASTFEESADYDRCMRQASGQAVNGLGNQAVTYAYHRRHVGW